MSDHAARILGLETEYALASSHTGPVAPGTPAPLTPAQAVDELYRSTARHARPRNHFMRNGGRLYVDLGSHPEYATAECRTIRDVIAQDRAGELILAQMADRANERLAERGIYVHVLKNNVDSSGTSYGCHENYQVENTTVDDLDPGFVTFLVTRQILTGCGTRDDRAEGSFRWSSRAPMIRCVVSPDPTHDRPLIVAREEPLSDGDRFARLQVTFADSNVAETTTALKVGLTASVLDLLESGGSLRDLALADPIQALHATSLSGGATRLELADGRSMTALDLQDAVLQRCEEARHEHSEYAEELARARRIVDAFRSGATDAVASEIDWMIKGGLMAEAARASGWDSPRVARLELAYHDLDPRHGLAGRLRAAGLMSTLVSDEEARTAITVPPQTRAAVRGAFVSAAEDGSLLSSVSWTHVRVDSPPRPQIDLLDAGQTQNDDVDALIAEMATFPPYTGHYARPDGLGRPG